MVAQPPDINSAAAISTAPVSPLIKDPIQAPSSSSSSVTSADFTAFPPPAEVLNLVAVKEEEEDYVGDDEIALSFDGFGLKTPSYCSSSSVQLPKPMEGLNESGPPPFLKKTFEMVEDPATNETVSWSKNGDSFIVWDAFDFSKNLLPKYFKHSNFSSFIRQLNTYGFRKIDPDKWEFANEGFRGGKKHLLKNIKRRNRHKHNKYQQERGNSHGDESKNLVLESQIESLKIDQDQLRLEILKLRDQQEESETRISTIGNRIQSADNKQLQMLIFLAKVTKSRSFLGNFLGKIKQNGGEFSRKRRLLESSPDERYDCRNQARQQLATMQTQLADILGEGSEQGKAVPKLFDANLNCDAENQESVYHLMTEKLLDDGEVNRSSIDENLDVNDSKIYLELEDLIGKPRTWGGFGCI